MITKTDIVTLEFHTIATPKVLPLYAQFKSGESTKRFVAVGDAVARALFVTPQARGNGLSHQGTGRRG